MAEKGSDAQMTDEQAAEPVPADHEPAGRRHGRGAQDRRAAGHGRRPGPVTGDEVVALVTTCVGVFGSVVAATRLAAAGHPRISSRSSTPSGRKREPSWRTAGQR